jgi:hypothetical protein
MFVFYRSKKEGGILARFLKKVLKRTRTTLKTT